MNFLKQSHNSVCSCEITNHWINWLFLLRLDMWSIMWSVESCSPEWPFHLALSRRKSQLNASYCSNSDTNCFYSEVKVESFWQVGELRARVQNWVQPSCVSGVNLTARICKITLLQIKVPYPLHTSPPDTLKTYFNVTSLMSSVSSVIYFQFFNSCIS